MTDRMMLRWLQGYFHGIGEVSPIDRGGIREKLRIHLDASKPERPVTRKR